MVTTGFSGQNVVMAGFSERNIDYGNLWRLLKQRRWREANEETLLKLLEASGRIESMVAAGELSQEGMDILFQLFGTSGRVKILEALARSERLEKIDIKALFSLLPQTDREFHLYRAIDLSEKLTTKEKKVLQRLIDLPCFSKSNLEVRHTRQELFKLLLLGWQEQDWHLIRGDIALCPCQDLQTIDDFWRILSGGRFGFSIQSRIWEMVFKHIPRGNREAYGQAVEDFGEIVDWRRNNSWIDYDAVIFAWKPEPCFSIENARYGHLPFFPRMGWWHWVGGMEAIINRLGCCNCISGESSGENWPTDRLVASNRSGHCDCGIKDGMEAHVSEAHHFLPSTFSRLKQPGIWASACSSPLLPHRLLPN